MAGRPCRSAAAGEARPMILVFEMTWTGLIHAPGNSATVQVIARAFPEQRIRMHAEAEHLAALRADTALMALPNIELVEITVAQEFLHRPAVVSWSRLAQEFRTVRAALGQVPRDEPCLVVLISTTATGSVAAAWACRLSGRRSAVQIGLHGDLNEAVGWRSRNPLVRAVDFRATLEARHPVPLRFLVLETAIREAMAGFAPAAAARTDVLPLPVNTTELAAVTAGRLEEPVRFGFVGLGTADKGFGHFLAIAAAAKARWGGRVEFVHVGRVPEDWDGAAAGGNTNLLAQPVTRAPLPRAEFLARLGGLHYVLLPYRRGYYDLSASGGLIDALTWLKPVIATRVPLTEQYLGEYGDIGLLCEDAAGLGAAVDAVLAAPDAARYDRQVAALAAARETRAVEALATRYRAFITAGFPGLLAPMAPGVGP